MMKPVAYEGGAPYIFISYSHQDSDSVFQFIRELTAQGCRVWYDDGIAPGSEWPEDIAQHLNAAQMVIAVITPRSMASENCRREINFSLSMGKPFLSVILEQTDMPLGMQMQLSARQSIPRYNYPTWESFIEKVLKCPDIAPCRDGQAAAPQARPAAPSPAESQAALDAKLMAVITEAEGYADKGDHTKELETLTGTLSFAPRSCMLMIRIGRCYRRLGMLKKALEYYEKAQEINPKDPTIYTNMGAVYFSVQEYAAARPYYEKAIALIEADPLSASKNDVAVSYGNYALCVGLLGDLRAAKKNLIAARKAGYAEDTINTICERLKIKPKSVMKDSFWG